MKPTAQQEPSRAAPTLSSVRAAYASGELDKAAYLRQMHAQHARLYAYRDLLRESNLLGIEIIPEGVRVVFRDPPMRLWCPELDLRAAPVEALNFGDYEPEALAVAQSLLSRLPQNAIVVDVGANIGFYSIGLSMLFPEIKVHAFEPIPSTLAQLRANLEINPCANVTVYSHGLGEREDSVTFHTYPTQSVAASRERILDDVPTEQITCRLRTLDAVRAENGLRVDFLKCDVEGAERSVFAGAHQTLEEDRPIIFSEMLRKWSAKYGYHPNDLIADLARFGYECHAIGEQGLQPCPEVTEETVETNFIFLDPGKH